MSAVDQLFAELRRTGRKALVTFVTAGDPDLGFTREVLGKVVRAGSNLCEVGIPYSDPIADGPVIQASYTRALESGFRWPAGLEMLGRSSGELSAPLVTMISYAIVHRIGPERFVHQARAAGVAGTIVPDLPLDESTQLAQICCEADLSLIQLVTPTTPRERALRIAQASTGFLYYVSVTGITGERQQLPESLVENVRWLREQTDCPVCIGFGISRPEQAAHLAAVADGVVVGSAIVRRIAEASTQPHEEVLRSVGQYVSQLRRALDGQAM